jgi:hypothetical protein
VRKQVLLFNIATVVTVVIGVTVLYGRGRYCWRGLGAHDLALGAKKTETVEHGNHR